jgi:hypothetical protein
LMKSAAASRERALRFCGGVLGSIWECSWPILRLEVWCWRLPFWLPWWRGLCRRPILTMLI